MAAAFPSSAIAPSKELGVATFVQNVAGYPFSRFELSSDRSCGPGNSVKYTLSVQVRDAGNLLTRAGLMIPSVDLDEVTVHYSGTDNLVQHIR